MAQERSLFSPSIIKKIGGATPDNKPLTEEQKKAYELLAKEAQKKNSPLWHSANSVMNALFEAGKGLVGFNDPEIREGESKYSPRRIAGTVGEILGAGLPFSAYKAKWLKEGKQAVNPIHGTPNVIKDKFDFSRTDNSDLLGSMMHGAENPDYSFSYAGRHPGSGGMKRSGEGRPNVIALEPKAENVLDVTQALSPDDLAAVIAAVPDEATRRTLIKSFKDSVRNDMIGNPYHRDSRQYSSPESYVQSIVNENRNILGKNTSFDAFRHYDGMEKAWAFPKTTPVATPWGTPIHTPEFESLFPPPGWKGLGEPSGNLPVKFDPFHPNVGIDYKPRNISQAGGNYISPPAEDYFGGNKVDLSGAIAEGKKIKKQKQLLEDLKKQYGLDEIDTFETKAWLDMGYDAETALQNALKGKYVDYDTPLYQPKPANPAWEFPPMPNDNPLKGLNEAQTKLVDELLTDGWTQSEAIKYAKDFNNYWSKNAVNPSPNVSFLKDLGGSHGAKLLDTSSEGKVVFKPNTEIPILGEMYGSKIANLINKQTPIALPADLPNFGGRGTIQKYFANTSSIPHVDQLSGRNIEDLQQEHIVDWLIGNHDAHKNQFLRDGFDNIIPIDKGQSFKHWKDEVFHPDYHPNKVYGEAPPIYSFLKGKGDPKFATRIAEDIRDNYGYEILGLAEEYTDARLGVDPNFKATEFMKHLQNKLQFLPDDVKNYWMQLKGK